MDKKQAYELLQSFQHCAYKLSKLEEFQMAARLLYGPEWVVEVDIVQRMRFTCSVCHKSMTCAVSAKEHTLSEGHMKALDFLKQKEYKRTLSSAEVITLGDLLLNSYVKPIGLCMIEEYRTGKKLYYNCILCDAYSDVDSMYNHVIGTKHTEKYIDMKMGKKDVPFLTSKMREEYRDQLLKEEGLHMNNIKTKIGEKFKPSLWEKKKWTQYRTLSHSSTTMSRITSCSSIYEPDPTTLPKSKSPERAKLDVERPHSQARLINKRIESNSLGRTPAAEALVEDSLSKEECLDLMLKLADQIVFISPEDDF
ncbi:uncharacterized protein LOC125046155 isoform X3 [Penaeus chinensis]|uniref:uncharacterized protein LOC125046155 isoform X3 n=1 Tax=Penaeus chinensis TaxID=139456 RepID=UPI001FB5FC12|nr:uncharacterized protein LOC125046155 isoform X3 [Penaeus chinensis]